MPYVIQYLVGLRTSTGDRLVQLEMANIYVPAVPPGMTITFTSGPIVGDYCYIGYEANFGPEMVPHAFDFTWDQFGSKAFDGNVSQWPINNSINGLLFITANEPSRGTLTNNSEVAQYYELFSWFVSIKNKQSYDQVMDAIYRLGNSTYQEEFYNQANSLLHQMSMVPRDPVTG